MPGKQTDCLPSTGCCGGSWRSAEAPDQGHYLVEMEFDFSIEHPAKAFDQASGLVVRLANADNLLQRRSGGHGEGILVDDLVPGVQLRHNEMDGSAIGQHAMAVRVPVRLGP